MSPSPIPPGETPARHARFEALRALLPRLANMDLMPVGVNLVELENEAIQREANELSWAEVSKNGTITPSHHAWAVARNRLRVVIAGEFTELLADSYLRKKLHPTFRPPVMAPGIAAVR